MIILRWFFPILILTGTGCSSSKPLLQATWYLVEETTKTEEGTKEKPKAEMYVAILNQSQTTIVVQDIILNADENDQGTGWFLSGVNLTLRPGRILFRPVTEFGRGDKRPGQDEYWGCRVPVAVTVVVDQNNRRWNLLAKLSGRDNDRISVETLGEIPTSVPRDWQKECQKNLKD
jgi:hypothetical protein